MNNTKHKNNPWLTLGILKSIKTKNKLFLKAKCKYRNKLTFIIRKAKEQYYRATLDKIRNKSSKLWSHINSFIKVKSKPNIPIKSEELNNFFTSVLKTSPALQC